MANRFIVKKNSTAGVAPTAGTGATQLLSGELAINLIDEKLFFINAAGIISHFLSASKTTAISTTSTTAGNVGARSFLMMGG